MMLQDIELMTLAREKGKIVILKGWPGFDFTDNEMMARSESALYELAKKAITFPLASFLIVAQEYSCFNYTWGYRSHH